MKEFTYTIVDKDGMHARPAGRLAACAKQLVCTRALRADLPLVPSSLLPTSVSKRTEKRQTESV